MSIRTLQGKKTLKFDTINITMKSDPITFFIGNGKRE